MNIPLDEQIYFDCITCTPSTGAAVDADSTPTFAVYEEATDTDIGIGGNLTKRTSLTGNYRGSFTLSSANGFEVGKWYSIIGSAVVGGVTGKAVLKNFRCVAAEAIAGKVKADVDALLGTAWLTPATAGTPDINVKLISGDATAADNAEAFFDGTGYAGTNNVIPTVTAVTGSVGSVTGAVGSVTGAVGSVTGSVTVGTIAANAVTASALAADAVAEIADGVWDEATSGHTTAGTTGKALADATAPSAAAVADAVWDEALSGHLTAGSTGEALNAAGSAGDPWTTTLPGSYTGSQAGKMLSDILTDTGTTLQGELDGIQADTEDIQARLPAALVSGRIDASVGAMAANTLTASALATDAVTEIQSGLATPTNITAGTITTVTNLTNAPTSGDLTATMKASVNAEVLDVLNVDTFAELTSPPAATSSLRAKLTWLFMWARNKATATSTQRKLYADDGTTVVSTEALSDDATTYTKGEAS